MPSVWSFILVVVFVFVAVFVIVVILFTAISVCHNCSPFSFFSRSFKPVGHFVDITVVAVITIAVAVVIVVIITVVTSTVSLVTYFINFDSFAKNAIETKIRVRFAFEKG